MTTKKNMEAVHLIFTLTPVKVRGEETILQLK